MASCGQQRRSHDRPIEGSAARVSGECRLFRQTSLPQPPKVSLDELRVVKGHVFLSVRYRVVRRDGKVSTGSSVSLLSTPEQCETGGYDTVRERITWHFAHRLPSEVHCLVIIAGHHMRRSQAGNRETDARVERAQAHCAGEVFGGLARITDVKANPAA